ncbi:hypothetical protein HYALB_00004712 [Hymenoscyphus albidus]|uniref:Histone-lysine N-methyltransferase, H3 lysine-36 specific n=1 Tax=Hymenoscyphus albidus TaxID=595503 RepID=A0A9N9LV25_9HELO|nr:hypothetical protein HYALB_00004712 [Hymenoscyphus albidus]
MADDTREVKPEVVVDAALGSMKLGGSSDEETIALNGTYGGAKTHSLKKSRSSTTASKESAIQSPNIQTPQDSSNSEQDEQEEVIGGDIVVTVEPGKAPKLSRKSLQKVIARPPPLFSDLDDVKEEAVQVFQVIKECIYGSKGMGASQHDSLDCDCSEDWQDGKNHACGEDSDCINRATKMECVDDECNCGVKCENQRFQRRRYADVSVIRTEKKGYGLRANTDLNANDFVFEYIGEVINEPTFRKRTIQYDQEGIKHFYFMSLTKNEFVDATKKGNLGRFCNHSCNPNCYVDKWVVGNKLRMGIFAERNIQKGEELVFNYNVDRYGADPQPCYCAEPNCTGFIGGKTQTERATKLSHATIEALGIDDGDGWDTAVAKKPRKKKTGEDDEEYVNNVQPKGLDEDGVRKVMATLMQCKEKWIAVKLLGRIQRCDDDRVRNKVVQMHGYQILRSTFTTWKEDNNVILQILDILYHFPRLTRNKISDSKIEAVITSLVDSEHEDVASEAKRLLAEWGKLEVAYRIPRKKYEPNSAGAYERRSNERPEEVVKSPAPALVAPAGPKNCNNFHRPAFQSSFSQRQHQPRRHFPLPLPPGWHEQKDDKGKTYYWISNDNVQHSQWERPRPDYLNPQPEIPKATPKSVQTAKALQDIIQGIVSEAKSQTPTQSVTTDESTPKEKKKPVEKWRSLSEEKQMKLYENTLFPHIKHVMQKFTKVLPKEDLKRFAKEVGKKLVASDFKNKRVEDPTKISANQEKKVKKFVREYFEKAVEKKKESDKRKRDKLQKLTNGITPVPNLSVQSSPAGDVETSLSNDTPTPSLPPSPIMPSDTPIGSPDTSRKRTREDEDDGDSDSNKRFKEADDDSIMPTPPPPPPPPSELCIPDAELEPREETEEEKELRKQEEDLMRENEEAMKMDLDGNLDLGTTSDVVVLSTSKGGEMVNGSEMENQPTLLMERNQDAFGANGNVAVGVNGTSLYNEGAGGLGSEKMEGLEKGTGREREEVMSH